jgi:DNA-binding XRE family transcriptional regulator
MLAVVKTPRTRIEIKGHIPKRILQALKEQYGAKVQLVLEDDNEKMDVFETEWYKRIKAKTTPGDNLRIYRQNAGMTLQRVGELLDGMPRQHVSNMEKGIRPISKKVALKLAAIFKVSVEKFIG